jgi:predicted  nucleic acid-binding Zn-ribbon protein
VEARLVFAGYGITAPDLTYDDYEGIDASGKIAVILRKEPQVADPKSRFGGTRGTQHAFFATKIENAIKHGAAAVVLVNDPESVRQAVQQVQDKIARETQRRDDIRKQLDALPAEADNSRATLTQSLQGVEASIDALNGDLQKAQRGILGVSEAGRRAQDAESIPVVSVARDLVSRWIEAASGQTLEQIEQEIDSSGSPRSLLMDEITMKLQMELEPLQAATSNVIGVLPGRGELADQTVVIGAHYDHVGMGGEGSLAPGTIAVHNGADDNASGTTALLATAERVRERLADQPSHRRVVLIAFSAEERGLLGSKHYVRNPRFPLENTVAMVNLDMVGRLRDNELTVYGMGSSPSFDGLVEQVNSLLAEPFRLFKVASGYGPSDHQSFYEAGIPVLFFFTGLHNDYHRPSDDVEKIDFQGLDRIAEIVSQVAMELAIQDERPEYAKTDNRVEIRRQLTAFLGVSLGDRSDHVVITNVVQGGPAEKAGIRVSDRLQQLGDQAVGSSQQVIDWVRRKSPGDRAKVVVTRDGATIELTVELSPRPE